VSARRALISYRNWLEAFGQPVVLVFHNGFSFDIHILLRHFLRLKVEPPSNVTFICDTLPTFRKLISTREIENFKLASLAKFVKIEFKFAHDALFDSDILAKICLKFAKTADISLETLCSHYKKPFKDFVKKAKEKHDSH